MTPDVILGILSLAAKYGIPAVTDIIAEWNNDTPITLNDIETMELRFTDPAKYFKKEG